METYIVRFIDGPLEGQEKEVLTELIGSILTGETLSEYSLGATTYRMHDTWFKDNQAYAEYLSLIHI